VKTAGFLDRKYSTLLCDHCRNYLRDIITEDAPRGASFSVSAEFQGASGFCQVNVVRTLPASDSVVGGSRLKLPLCGPCCNEAARILKASGGSVSDLEVYIEQFGRTDEPLIEIIVHSRTTRKAAAYESAGRQGLWWHTL
jgi:hypothetical protein